ncbi:putative ribonuclease H-like domain-containing protein [Tanacetum coccineum]|uniref:Ribonuclease H-like domain-containing protein n=1 Tax=Tanacetum coccineum TaxID=301880 RepID=A0ABQ5G8S6_9ASTR
MSMIEGCPQIQTLKTLLSVHQKVKGSTLKQSIWLHQHISQKDILKRSRARCLLIPTVLLTQMKSMFLSCSTSKSYAPITHDEEDILVPLQKLNALAIKKLGQFAKRVGIPEEDLKTKLSLIVGCSGSMNRKTRTSCLILKSNQSWVFFLAYKDETYDMLHDLIVGLENRLRHKVKTIRTPQQNGVAERKNRTLIEAARTMLADSLLPIQFWAEAVNTACYVLNRVLVTKPQMKTPYEILMGRSPNISFMRPFGCPLTILNTLESIWGHKKGQDCLQCKLSENQKSKGKGPELDYDLDHLTHIHNYIPPHPMQSKELLQLQKKFHCPLQNKLYMIACKLMQSRSLAKAHNDDQKDCFLKRKRKNEHLT